MNPKILLDLLVKLAPKVLGNVPLASRAIQYLAGDKPWFKRVTIWTGLVWACVYLAATHDWFAFAPVLNSFMDAANKDFALIGPLLVALGINRNITQNLKGLGVADAPDIAVPPATPAPRVVAAPSLPGSTT